MGKKLFLLTWSLGEITWLSQLLDDQKREIPRPKLREIGVAGVAGTQLPDPQRGGGGPVGLDIWPLIRLKKYISYDLYVLNV